MRSRTRAKAFASLVATGLLLAACGSDDESKDTAAPTTAAAAPDTTAAAPATTAAASETTTAGGGAADLTALADECKANGSKVNLIALPDSWANYKGILAAFGTKYPGVEHPVANPDGSSQEELDAIVNLKGADDMPDAIDVSPAKAAEAVTEGLITPYQPTTWDEIPDNLKDPAGNWVAAYYGIMAMGTNTTIVKNAPKSFADLKKPEYKGLVALNGDPREAGSAFAAVMAASLANGGSADDIMPGIAFFGELAKSGNLIPTAVTPATVLSGDTPIAIDWSYNFPGLVQQMEDAGFSIELNFPADGVYGGYYAQGVVKDSPHQACSKLWIEHILSDEGALGYLEGGAIPARLASLDAAGKITGDIQKNSPPAELLDQVSFMTAEQVATANQVLTDNWGPMVADV